jgi:hypothetical protein
MSNGERGGPYLTGAFLCEKVLQEKDGVLSAIRIIDRFISSAGVDAPAQLPPIQISGQLIIMFKSGDARGSYTVGIRPVTPSGRVTPTLSVPILFEGDADRGSNLNLAVGFEAKEEGVYWFDILLNDELVTRVPVRVIYQRLAVGTSGATPIH